MTDWDRWDRDGHEIIAEAEAIADLCRAAGRPDLAAWPDGVAARTRERLARPRPGFWRQVLTALAGYR